MNRDGQILLHDNAGPGASQTNVHTLHSLNYEILRHPLCLSDISPIDFHLFKHFEHFIRNKIFPNKEEATESFITSMDDIFFKDGIKY